MEQTNEQGEETEAQRQFMHVQTRARLELDLKRSQGSKSWSRSMDSIFERTYQDF